MKRILKSELFISIMFFIMTICIFGPLELYITNQAELWFSFTDALILSGIMCVVAVFLLVAIGMLLRGKARSFFAAMLFGCTLCMYIQGNYLNINYGVLDGKAINWGAYDTYAILDTAFWGGILIAVFILWIRKFNLFSKIQRYASMFIMAMQMLTLCVLIITGGVLSTDDETSSYLSKENLYSIGKQDNIVIFILDAFDEAYLEELFVEEPGKYETILSDFTHYTNVAVGGARTNSALPIIITGQHYPGSVPYDEYIKTAFNSDGLYTELKQQGYTVNLYSDYYYVPSNAEQYVANLVTGKYRINSPFELTKKYGTLNMYKYMPHLLKRFFWLYTGDFEAYKEADSSEYQAYTIDDAKFYSNLVEQRLQTVDGKYFTLIHMSGAHPPYDLDENAQYKENSTRIEKSKGALLIVHEYLEQMKALGVYDSSTVILMSDHGDVNPARGMMMMKTPYASGFTNNNAPISHFDLHNTIFELLGKEKGDSIFDIHENDIRVRMYYAQQSMNGTFYMTEYEIHGNPRDVGCGTATGIVLSPTTRKTKYKLGEELTFGASGTVNQYVEKGVSALQVGFSWTDNQEVIFDIDLDTKPKNNLQIDLSYYTVYLLLGNQRLNIYVDDELLFEEVLASDASRRITLDVPAEKAADSNLIIKLELPDARIPAEIFGDGYDRIPLALALTGLRISEIDEADVQTYSMGTKLKFGSETNFDGYFVNGISHSTTTGYAWTDGPEILCRMLIDNKPLTDMKATMELASVYTNFGPQRVIFKVNNTICYSETLYEAKKISFTIPADSVEGNLLSFRIYLPDAKSPYAETGEGDRRTLGMAITGLCIEPDEQ